MKNSDFKMTPLIVEILLHYYYSNEDYPGDAPGIKGAHDKLIQAGILHVSTAPGRFYGCNQDALDVYINEILSIPLPVQQWVIKK